MLNRNYVLETYVDCCPANTTQQLKKRCITNKYDVKLISVVDSSVLMVRVVFSYTPKKEKIAYTRDLTIPYVSI